MKDLNIKTFKSFTKDYEETHTPEPEKETAEERRIKLFSRLMAGGIGERDAVAILGNVHHETGGTYDPAIKQRGVGKVKDEDWFKKTKAGRGTGILQWDGSRRVALKKFAEDQGKKWDDLEVQADFLIKELNTSEKGGFDKVKKAGSIGDKTVMFSKKVERPGKPHNDMRIKAANEMQEKIIKAKGSYYGGIPVKEEEIEEAKQMLINMQEKK